MPRPIRIPRAIDRNVFIPIDFDEAFNRRYLDKATNTQRTYKHHRAITPRNIAKSYGSIAKRTENALKGWAKGDGDRKFMYMRRGVDEFETSFPTIYKEVEKEFPDFQFRCKGNYWEAKPWDAPSSAWRTICYGMALAEAYKRRSSSWADVEHVLFDEFVDDGSRPISREVERWESIYDTMARNRPVTTLFMANPQLLVPGVMNPYFVADGVTVKENMPEWISMKKKSTLYWFPPEGKFGNQQVTDRQRELGDSDYAAMSFGGKFVHAAGIPIGKRGQFADEVCGVSIDGTWFSIWAQDDYLYAERGRTKSDVPRFTMSPRDISMGVRLVTWGDPLLAAIRSRFAEGAIVYEDTAVHSELQKLLVR